MHKSEYAIVVTGLLIVLMISYSVSHAGQSEALTDAAKRGDLTQVKDLLGKGADVNAKDRWGYTPLMKAVSEGQLEMVRLLLEKGADVNAKNQSGETALMSASWGGQLEMVRLLLEKGADVSAKAKSGGTVLIYAARGGKNLDVIKLLIEKGADVNAQNILGRTALMDAADLGRLEIVKLLIEKGADVNAKEKTYDVLSAFLLSIAKTLRDMDPSHLGRGPGRTALEIAKEKGHKEIVEYLKAQGAKE